MTWSKEARIKSALARHLKSVINQRSKFKSAGGMAVQPLSEKARQAREYKSNALFAAAGTKKKAPKSKGPTLAATKMAAIKRPPEIKPFDWRLYTNRIQAAHRKTIHADAASMIASAKSMMDDLHKKYDGNPAAVKALSASFAKLLAYERKLNQKFKVRSKHVEVFAMDKAANAAYRKEQAAKGVWGQAQVLAAEFKRKR